MENTQESKRDRTADASMGEPAGLPFEFEDRSDGSYQRAIEEVRAAWLWVQSRRAHGLAPN